MCDQHDSYSEVEIRELAPSEFAEAAALVRNSFARHIALGWSEAARETFISEVTPELFQRFAETDAYSIGFFQGRKLLGVLVMPSPTNLRMFFVEPSAIRQGIGRRLWQHARAHLAEHHPKVQTVELNASSFARDFYRRLGFAPLSQEYEYLGGHVTRMACWLPAERLGVSLV